MRYKRRDEYVEAIQWWPSIVHPQVETYVAGPYHPSKDQGTFLFSQFKDKFGNLETINPGDYIVGDNVFRKDDFERLYVAE